MELKLHPHKSSPIKDYDIFCSYQTSGDTVLVNFKVKKPKHLSWNINHQLSHKGIGNWGLWEHDVVEIFLQSGNPETPYLEIQLSPSAQKFALQIERPRKQFFTPLNFDFCGQSIIEDDTWTAQIEVDFPCRGTLRGGIFACLGPETKRNYFAMNPNCEDIPDFHRPDLFVKL